VAKKTDGRGSTVKAYTLEIARDGAGERTRRIKHKAFTGEERGSPFLGEGRAVWGMMQQHNFSGMDGRSLS